MNRMSLDYQPGQFVDYVKVVYKVEYMAKAGLFRIWKHKFSFGDPTQALRAVKKYRKQNPTFNYRILMIVTTITEL